jgi:lysylphosphatidylglycerol synthetase-like protein (DUF2156 family)
MRNDIVAHTRLPSHADAPGVVKALLLLERSVRIMQCGLLGLLFLLSLYFGLPWRSHLFGIAVGFGLFASIDLAAAAMRSQFGFSAASAYSQIRNTAYVCFVLIWIFYLLTSKPAAHQLDKVCHRELDKWNQVLVEIRER